MIWFRIAIGLMFGAALIILVNDVSRRLMQIQKTNGWYEEDYCGCEKWRTLGNGMLYCEKEICRKGWVRSNGK